jgi:predicted  nucleic acid-binding Zn-ribbon protein
MNVQDLMALSKKTDDAARNAAQAAKDLVSSQKRLAKKQEEHKALADQLAKATEEFNAAMAAAGPKAPAPAKK